MKNGDKRDLLDTASLMQEGYSFLLSNAGKAVAILTLLISTLVIFTEVSFMSLSGNVLTPALMTLLLASYTMYLSLEDAGERLGEETTEFKSASLKYSELRSKISADMIPALRAFCRDYSEREAGERRRTALFSFGLGEDEYKDFLNGKRFDFRRTVLFRRIKGIKPTPLTPSMLLSSERSGVGREIENPEAQKLLRLLTKMIPTTLCTLFTASLILKTKDGITTESLLDGILKLSSLPIVGFRGYTAGYSFSKNKMSAWLDTKCLILEGFLAENQRCAA